MTTHEGTVRSYNGATLFEDASTLSRTAMIDIGKAIISFRMNEYDQGAHCIMPGREALGNRPTNEEFTDLFEVYFDKIPASDKLNARQQAYLHQMGALDGDNDQYCNLYVGAIAQWFDDWGIEIGEMERSFMGDFKQIVSMNEVKDIETVARAANSITITINDDILNLLVEVLEEAMEQGHRSKKDRDVLSLICDELVGA